MKKAKTFKKIMAVALCVAMTTLLLPSALMASATTDNAVTKKGLVLSAQFEEAVSSYNFNAMKNFFIAKGIPTTGYENASNNKAAFLRAISTRFAGVDSNDISYIFIQSHGASNGNLIVSTPPLTLSELKNALDQIPGKKVLMINACYSGNAISSGNVTSRGNLQSSAESNLSEEYSQIMIDTFLGFNGENQARSGEFNNTTNYSVFCSSYATELSWTYVDSYAFAPYAWAKAAGYNIANNQTCAMAGDVNNDGIITATELQTSASAILETMRNDQHCCYYAPSPYVSVFFDEYPVGDANLDGILSMADVLAVRKHISGIEILTGDALQFADFNCDNAVNNQDVLALRQYLAA